MKSKYSVTFEFTTRPPLIYKGECEATSIRTLAARAIDLAIDQNYSSMIENKESNRNWSTILVVLDRHDFMNQPESELINDFNNEI